MADKNLLLEVENLSMRVRADNGPTIVKDVSFNIGRGEIVGVVGESGSGKTMLGRTLMRLEPPVIERTAGDVRFSGTSIPGMTGKQLRAIRGPGISMVFQEPMTSLNPSMTIGRQLEEPLRLHSKFSASQRKKAVADILKRVGIADTQTAMTAFPHQYSGGMRQRIMLASAMLLHPALLIADEPTTALDALVQRDVLELMLEMARDHGTALMLISHDLPMVARYCSRILVMRHGEIVESGPTDAILTAPQHPYTRDLLSAMPSRGPRRDFAPDAPVLVEAKGISVEYRSRANLLAPIKTKTALHPTDLSIRQGEVVALVGASGSGKTTLGRAIAGLVPPSAGTVVFRGKPVVKGNPDYMDYRRNCQMIFQDPFGSLDPRMTVEALVAEALRHERLSRDDVRKRVADMLVEVGLDERYLPRLPHELSGGQRQRVAIARAVVGRPDFVIADEAVSALDVTVRAQVLKLLAELQRRYGFSCLFISHDLGVVEQLSDRVVVMRDGAIVEQGDRDTIFDAPRSDYTRALLSAIPTLTRTEKGVALSWRFAGAEAETVATLS